MKIKRREDRSWLGILIGIDRLVGGTYYVKDYDFQGGGTVAFEDPGLAAMVALKFGM